VPGSPTNLTKQELLAVQNTKVPREPILVTEKWRRTFFPRFGQNDWHYTPLCTAFGSVQSLCPSNFSILAMPLVPGLQLHANSMNAVKGFSGGRYMSDTQ